MATQTEAILGDERVKGVRLKRMEIAADIVVMAAGIRPNVEWPKDRSSL